MKDVCGYCGGRCGFDDGRINFSVFRQHVTKNATASLIELSEPSSIDTFLVYHKGFYSDNKIHSSLPDQKLSGSVV